MIKYYKGKWMPFQYLLFLIMQFFYQNNINVVHFFYNCIFRLIVIDKINHK